MENINLKIRKLQEYLVGYLNSIEDIPIEVKRLMVYEVYMGMVKTANNKIKEEQNAFGNDEEKDDEEKDGE